MRNPIAAAVLAVSFACTAIAHAQDAAASPARGSDADLVWDLTRLFPDDAAWDAERRALAAEVEPLRALEGTPKNDAASLRAALDRVSAFAQRLRRLGVYAGTQASTDHRDRRHQERESQFRALAAQYASAVAWIDPEIQSLGAGRIAAMQAAEPGLRRHAVRLRQALRRAPHTLAREAEAIVAALAPVIGSSASTRSLLVHADIAWPSIEVDGRSARVDDNGYVVLRQHVDRAVRKRAFDAFWKAHAQFENTFGALLAQRVQQGVIEARLRRHASAAAASLADSEVPEPVLRTLVAEVNAALPVLHRYFALRKRLLGLPDLHYYDVYPDLVASARRYPPAESAALTLAATKPLGDEYQRSLQLALSARTMHVRPALGKSSGAYATSVYGLVPFIFLNHHDDFQSLATYAHEWGHGMHSVLAQRAQPYESAGYPLFLAEIASTTNEVLLTEHLLRTAASRDERVFVLAQILERLRASYFRQAMFAEFELAVHDAFARGEALSGQRFTQTYCALLRKYHGADAGVMAIDSLYCTEWAYIPHFHRPFYVYAYATSTAAAQHYGAAIAAGQPGAAEAYLGVLRAGSSVPPHELLLRTGLDLASPAPYRALAARMNAVIDEIEALLR